MAFWRTSSVAMCGSDSSCPSMMSMSLSISCAYLSRDAMMVHTDINTIYISKTEIEICESEY